MFRSCLICCLVIAGCHTVIPTQVSMRKPRPHLPAYVNFNSPASDELSAMNVAQAFLKKDHPKLAKRWGIPVDAEYVEAANAWHVRYKGHPTDHREVMVHPGQGWCVLMTKEME